MTNCDVSYSEAAYCGGAIHLEESDHFSKTECDVSYNAAQLGGGLMGETAKNITLKKISFSCNKADFLVAPYLFSNRWIISH